MSEKEKVEGYVEHIIFRNEENGYTVLNLSMKGRELTCVGTLPMIGEGELIEASGDYIEHAAYGKQFRIESYETKVPQDSVALERYLGSGAIKGVGAALAARIVRRFGDDTLRIIEEEPERLAEVKGISERKAREIAQQVAEKAEMQNAMIFLSGYGIALNLGAKIYQQYGDNVYRILKENPYKMAEDIAGVGFRTADEIAGKIGIAVDSEFRIKSGLSYVLNQATAEGHVYLPEPVLLRRGQELLGVEPERMQKSLQDMAIDKKAVIRELPAEREGDEPLRIVYASQYYYLELSTARMLHELNITCEEDREAIEKRIGKIEKKYQIELDEMQKTAVVEAAYSGLMILTGGPGTGKTTTINAMIHYFEAEGLDIFLAAPTGRAAKRMTEATGCEACTIHRLLELTGNVDDSSANVHFERNGVDPRTSINGKFKTLELQGIERIIKIIRAIEKDKIDKLLPAPEAHSDELLDRADKQVTQLKAEVERLKQAGAPDVEDRRKLGQVVRLLENAFDQKNFKKAEKGTDYFVAPVYLEMLLYKVKEICS